MKKLSLLLFNGVFCTLIFTANAQTNVHVSAWKYLDETGLTVLGKIDTALDGGYFYVGSGRVGFNHNDGVIYRLSETGIVKWAKYFGSSMDDGFLTVAHTSDNGCIAVGQTQGLGVGTMNTYVVCVDSVGNELWSRTFGGENLDDAQSVRQTSDGGFIICGSSTSSFYVPLLGARCGGTIIKLDNNGNIQWVDRLQANNVLQQWEQIIINDIRETSAGDFICTGFASDDTATYTLLALKISSSGTVMWAKKMHGTGMIDLSGHSVVETSEHDFVFLAYGDYSTTQNIWLMKLDAAGSFIWGKRYSSQGLPLNGLYLEKDHDESLIIGGTATFLNSQPHFKSLLLKTSPSGNVQWCKVYDKTEQTLMAMPIRTGYAFAQFKHIPTNTNYTNWIIQTDKQGKVGACLMDSSIAVIAVNCNFPSIVPHIYVYPNCIQHDTLSLLGDRDYKASLCSDSVAQGKIQSIAEITGVPRGSEIPLSAPEEDPIVEIYDVRGRLIYKDVRYNTINSLILEAGIYFCRRYLPDGTVQIKKICVKLY